tara:strand:+ start:266 stop:2701 length:2436 start_codon:yes stop_codon:yes gene_type:complete
MKKVKHLLLGFSFLILSASLFAQEQEALNTGIEEIIVTARQQAESLQDVPVTVSVLSEVDLDRYNITNLTDAAKMVPNFRISMGGSGNGSNIYLRGIGSSSISAAFDQSVAINIDGVVVNRGRFIHNAYLDMAQIEVLKGPQSLYFGKSATAGVISIKTNDPTDEFEAEFGVGVETEHETTFFEGVISGPISDNLLARFAFGTSETDEIRENYSFANDPMPYGNGTKPYFGEESSNARLTLLWEPMDNLTAKLKFQHSKYENDGGGTMFQEEWCADGLGNPSAHQLTAAPIAIRQGVDDCVVNGNTSKINLEPGLRAGLPYGADSGEPFLDQETDMLSLQVDWDISDGLSLTSVTSLVKLDHTEMDDYSYGAGVYGGLHVNEYEHTSQEFRLTSNFDSAINFQAGVFLQEIEQRFEAHQYAANLSVTPNFLGPVLGFFGDFDLSNPLIGPDPVTGNMYDYRKDHYLDTDVFSASLAFYIDVNEKTELSIGARYTDEEKEGYILFPYFHSAAAALGFAAPPRVDGIEFEDDNLSPEIAINYYITEDTSVFVAYKKAFKSGGIDNSALPTASLNTQSPNFAGFDALVYDSEEVDGFEIGLKSNLLDNNMRLNATYYKYEYTDLQVQLFDAAAIQFSTFNAGAVETEGFEADVLWYTEIPGLTVRGQFAWSDATNTGDFITPSGENLNGSERSYSPEIAGSFGLSYDSRLSNGWRYNLSTDARYSDDYGWGVYIDSPRQDSFWINDVALSLYSEDGQHSFNLIGRNLGDEIVIITGGAAPGRVATQTGTSALIQDQAVTTSQGRTFTLQYKYKM